MLNFQYQIIRYRHDYSTGEFINVGVAFYIPADKHLIIKTTNKYRRISEFYSGVSGSIIRNKLKDIEKKLNAYSKKLKSNLIFSNTERLDLIISELYPNDNGSIQFSQLFTGITENSDYMIMFNDLYEKLIDKYTHHYDRSSRTDEDAKKLIYNKYFDKLNISNKLTKKELKTANDSFEFNGWKNGKWNCYKPISFDLLDIDSIKDKVYKWKGIKSELFTSNEPFALYFLSLSPRNIKGHRINSFIKKQLEQTTNGQEVHVIEENKLESFSKSVSREVKLNHQ